MTASPKSSIDSTPDRRKLTAFLGVVLVAGFLATTLASFYVSRGSIRAGIVDSELPLVADNVYSEVQRDLIRPIFISSMMASDTFLRDWVLAGEVEVPRMTKYLKEVKDRFGAFTSFFISERTRIYYYADGILKTVREDEPRDAWYFRVRKMTPDYEINFDPDLANRDALTIFINYRVHDYSGNYIGIAGVGLAADAVQGLIRKYSAQFQREIYFVDRAGRIVLAREGAPASGTPLRDRPGMGPLVDALLAEDAGTAQYEADGKTYFVNVRHIEALDWFLFVEKTEEGALAEIRSALYFGLVFCLLVTALVLATTRRAVDAYQARIEELAVTDRLTGLANRQAYDVLMGQALREIERDGRPLSLAIVDVDDFKSVNDRHGHLVGDRVLKSIAAAIKGALGAADVACRWGGDEFMLVMKGRGRAQASALAEAIRSAVEAAPAAYGEDRIRQTVSVGVAERAPGETADDLVARADGALRRAKLTGKNRTAND